MAQHNVSVRFWLMLHWKRYCMNLYLQNVEIVLLVSISVREKSLKVRFGVKLFQEMKSLIYMDAVPVWNALCIVPEHKHIWRGILSESPQCYLVLSKRGRIRVSHYSCALWDCHWNILSYWLSARQPESSFTRLIGWQGFMLLGKAFLFTENKTSNRFEIGSYLFDPITQTLMHAG